MFAQPKDFGYHPKEIINQYFLQSSLNFFLLFEENDNLQETNDHFLIQGKRLSQPSFWLLHISLCCMCVGLSECIGILLITFVDHKTHNHG